MKIPLRIVIVARWRQHLLNNHQQSNVCSTQYKGNDDVTFWPRAFAQSHTHCRRIVLSRFVLLPTALRDVRWVSANNKAKVVLFLKLWNQHSAILCRESKDNKWNKCVRKRVSINPFMSDWSSKESWLTVGAKQGCLY